MVAKERHKKQKEKTQNIHRHLKNCDCYEKDYIRT